MGLKANVNTDVNGDIIIEMTGGLDFENSVPLRNELVSLCNQNPKSVITLDLHGVDFVGSSGIGTFVQTINYLNTEWARVRLTNIQSEFIKVFQLYKLNFIEEVIMDISSTNFSFDKFNNLKKSYQKL